MTFLTVLLLLHSAALAGAPANCPNLSGEYVIRGEDGHVDVTVKQSRCETVEIEWWIHPAGDESKTLHKLRLDGKPHSDMEWFGDGKATQQTSARFIGRTLQIVTLPEVPSVTRPIDFELLIEPMANGDLCHSSRDGHPREKNDLRGGVMGRVKDSTKQAYASALDRSEHDCKLSPRR